MSKKKITVFQKFENTDMKHYQVVYLNHYGVDEKDIAKWTDYAVGTVRIYIKKFSHLIEQACKIFYHVTKKAKAILSAGRQYVYLFKFYDSVDNLICSKVGTTTRLPEKRLDEEIKYYRKHGIDVDSAEICSVIDCGEYPAEGAESVTRATFIHRYPTAFHKNDRFFGVDIPVRTFNTIVNNYLSNGIAVA